MKIAIVFAMCVVAALAAPADVEILRSDNNVSEDGYNFVWVTWKEEQNRGWKCSDGLLWKNIKIENVTVYSTDMSKCAM